MLGYVGSSVAWNCCPLQLVCIEDFSLTNWKLGMRKDNNQLQESNREMRRMLIPCGRIPSQGKPWEERSAWHHALDRHSHNLPRLITIS